MSNIQTGAERMPHDLSHLGFLAGQIGRLITISTTPVIAGDSFEMGAVGALRLSPLRRGLAIDSTVDIFTFYVPHRHVYGELWIKFMKDGVNATPLPTVNTTGYIDHAAFLDTINPDTNKIPKHLFQGYLNIYNNYFKAPWMPDRTEANPNELNQDHARYCFLFYNFFFNDTATTEIYTLSLHDALPILLAGALNCANLPQSHLAGAIDQPRCDPFCRRVDARGTCGDRNEIGRASLNS